MSKSIYEEALSLIENIDRNLPYTWLMGRDSLMKIKQTILQAQKQEKLLERLYNVCKEYKHMSIGLSDDSDFINIMNDIEELENDK
jgi:hypothetical protein